MPQDGGVQGGAGRVVCLLSSALSHIDFGGLGFLRLAGELRRQGHDVVWIAHPAHRARLEHARFRLIVSTDIQALKGSARGDPRAIEAARAGVVETVAALGPDLVLADRLLRHASRVAAATGCAVHAVGRFEPSPEFDRDHAVLAGMWLNPDGRAVSFLGRNFTPYPNSARTLAVRAFAAAREQTGEPDGDGPDGGEGVAVSFGRTGDPRPLMALIDDMAAAMPGLRIDAYWGGGRERNERIGAFLKDRPHVGAVGWGDLLGRLPRYAALAFPGGLGTLWHGIDQEIPMIVCPGHQDDQDFNARQVERLGLGARVTSGHGSGRTALEVVTSGRHAVRAQFAEAKSSRHFDCDMEGAARRLATEFLPANRPGHPGAGGMASVSGTG